MYALVNGEKTAAAPLLRGQCPGCDGLVIPKCGSIKRWHFAHSANIDCDPWYEGETDWHLDWKALFPKEFVEITIGRHRADISLSGYVIEFQHSPISPEQLRERQAEYKRVVWVFDASTRKIELRTREISSEVVRTGWDRAVDWAEENGFDNPEAFADNVGDDWEDERDVIYEKPEVSSYRTFR
jgi:hypothetical protein